MSGTEILTGLRPGGPPKSSDPPSVVIAGVALLTIARGASLVRLQIWRPDPLSDPPGSGWARDPAGPFTLSASGEHFVEGLGALNFPGAVESQSPPPDWVPGQPPDPRMLGANDPTNAPWPVRPAPFVPSRPLGAIFVQVVEILVGGPFDLKVVQP